jgi:hypothetical protein
MTIHKVLRQNDDSQSAAPELRRYKGQDDDATEARMTVVCGLSCFFAGSSPSDEQVDGDVGDGEQGAKRGGHSFQPLHDLLVLVHAAFELREAAGLSDTHDLFHLAL